jgi:hypothetical protein
LDARLKGADVLLVALGDTQEYWALDSLCFRGSMGLGWDEGLLELALELSLLQLLKRLILVKYS